MRAITICWIAVLLFGARSLVWGGVREELLVDWGGEGSDPPMTMSCLHVDHSFAGPECTSAGPDGRIYVVERRWAFWDSLNYEHAYLHKFSADGQHEGSAVLSDTTYAVWGMVADRHGALYLCVQLRGYPPPLRPIQYVVSDSPAPARAPGVRSPGRYIRKIDKNLKLEWEIGEKALGVSATSLHLDDRGNLLACGSPFRGPYGSGRTAVISPDGEILSIVDGMLPKVQQERDRLEELTEAAEQAGHATWLATLGPDGELYSFRIRADLSPKRIEVYRLLFDEE